MGKARGELSSQQRLAGTWRKEVPGGLLLPGSGERDTRRFPSAKVRQALSGVNREELVTALTAEIREGL